MKNADIPLWDKGDNTDNFTKGGGASSRTETRISSTDKAKKIEEIYDRILGRKPTNKEISYYKYRKLEEEDLIQKLLESDEFIENIEKVREFPELEKTSIKSKSTIIKLKAKIEDSEKEYLELKKLLKEKDSLINALRKEEKPFITNREELSQTQYKSFVKESNEQNPKYREITPVNIKLRKDGLLERLFDLISSR